MTKVQREQELALKTKSSEKAEEFGARAYKIASRGPMNDKVVAKLKKLCKEIDAFMAT